MTESRRERALRFFEHLYAGRPDAALDLLRPGATYEVKGRPSRLPIAGTYTKEELPNLLTLIASAVPHGVRQEITSTIAEENQVVVAGHVEATAASGQHYANNFVFIVAFDGDLIAHVDEYIDTQEANDVLFAAREA